jgi:membrane protease YdiL (CAAX protease family)
MQLTWIFVFGEVSSGLPFPSLNMTLISLVALVIGLPLIYVLSKALKLRPTLITIAKPKKQAVLASIMAIVLFVVVFAWRTLTHMFQFFDERSPFVIGTFDILWMAFLDGMGFVVLFIVMIGSGQKLGSAGIARKGLGKMFALGLVLSAIYLTLIGLLAPSLGGAFAGFSPELAYGFVLYAIVGFSEEIFWRGYIQTRLIAYSGKLKGLLITSLLFVVLWHFPVEFYMQSGAVLEALVNTLTRFTPSLLFGYLMLKSQNVLPSSIFHLFWDWNSLLWGLSF